MPGLVHGFHWLIGVISAPHGSGIIWCIGGKPKVCTVFCCTGFSGYRHIRHARCSTGTFCDNILHCTCQKRSGRIFDHLMGIRCGIIKQDIALMVKHLSIQDWFCIGSGICDRRISSGHLDIVNTSCDSAEGSRSLNIGKARIVVIIEINKRGKSEIFQIIVSGLESDIRQCI